MILAAGRLIRFLLPIILILAYIDIVGEYEYIYSCSAVGLEECMYDSYDETRKFAERKLRRRK